MTGILLTGMLNLNSTNQSKQILQHSSFTVSYHFRQNKLLFLTIFLTNIRPYDIFIWLYMLPKSI